MSSIKWKLADLAALPTDLLDLAKGHLRIDGTYEDAYIKNSIARALNWFERVTNVSVNPVTWVWAPDAGNFIDGRARVPVSPVSSFTAVDGQDVDISSAYELETMSTYGIGLFSLAGTFVDQMEVTLVSGYADADALDAGITDAVLRYTAHLYENREILVPGVTEQTPGWMTDVIATYWMPRL